MNPTRLLLLTSLFVLSTAPALRAQHDVLRSQNVIPLFPERPLSVYHQAKPDEIRIDSAIGVVVTKVHQPSVHHYAPIPRMATGGAVIIAPGGGYQVQAWDYEGTDFARRLAAEGMHVFVLRYRLPATVDAPDVKPMIALQDAQRSVQLVRSLADSLGYAPDKIAFMGFSAGGHLAASVAVHSLPGYPNAIVSCERFSSRPDLSLPIYPVIIMDDSGKGHQGSAVALLGEDYLNHPLRARLDLPGMVNGADVPPTFLVHASDDRVVLPENSLRYYSALVENETPVSLHIFAEGGHGFASGKHFAGPTSNWVDLMVEWLRSFHF